MPVSAAHYTFDGTEHTFSQRGDTSAPKYSRSPVLMTRTHSHNPDRLIHLLQEQLTVVPTGVTVHVVGKGSEIRHQTHLQDRIAA
jgi:hypothetical protein